MEFKTHGLMHRCAFLGLQHLYLIFSHIFQKNAKIRAKIGTFKVKRWNTIVEVYQRVWNWCRYKINTMSIQQRWTQSSYTIWCHHNKSNMADGRHFENHYISVSQPQIVRISWNLVRRRKFYPRRQKRDKKSEILKFKMANERRIENHFFLLITRLHRVRLIRNLHFGGIIARTRRLGDENAQFRKSNMAYGRHFEKSL